MPGTPGNYSNVIIYDEEKRYFYLQPQKNRPLLDDEVRNMHIMAMDELRRSIEHTQADVACPLKIHSVTAPTSNCFKVTVPSGMTGGQSNNFKVIGGSSIEDPAVLFIKGFYVFLTGDVEYKNQMYGSSNIDLNTESDKSKTLTLIPDLTTPTADRRDIVYVDLHFVESTAASGSDDDIYYDSGILDPRIGTASANRLRAVFDIRVYEGYTGAIDKTIFSEFLEGTPFSDNGILNSDVPTENHYRVPIAAIYREGGDTNIDSDKIVDLLTLYDKRVLTLGEISYMNLHGGYGDTAVFELNGAFTGFNPQFPDAKIDEGAFATGLNRGFDTEAFNTDSVTPRIVDNDGKFLMGAVQVGVETGTQTYPITAATGPEELNPGEIMAHEVSAQHVAVGYDRGITGKREYKDGISIHLQGLTGISTNLLNKGITGVAGLAMHNYTGETGIYTQFIETSDNYMTVDYKGRMGFNTGEPGWTGVSPLWNVSRYAEPVNLVLDINDSQRVRKHLFVDKDTYLQGDLFGKTWNIPSVVNKDNKAYFGYTGIPTAGLTDATGSVVFKPGITTQGTTGTQDYRGATGVAGFYESFDKDGNRLFTIGDLGEEFDRVVKTLYGTGLVPLYFTDTSLRYIPAFGETGIASGDVVTLTVDITDVVGNSTVTVTASGSTMPTLIESIREGIETGLQYYASSSDLTVTTISDPLDELLPLSERLKNDGKLIIKDKSSELDSIVDFEIDRGGAGTTLETGIQWTDSHYYGSASYGGETQDLAFAKLDLGEAANAWLFNGDVFFNGNGLLNRVTFSPNVIFRDDIFVYGDVYASSLKFDSATLNYMTVNQRLNALRYVNIGSGFDQSTKPVGGMTLGFGESSEISLISMQTNEMKSLWLDINGDAKAQNFIADLCGTVGNVRTVLGNSYPRSNDVLTNVYFKIGGSSTDTTDPYGLHLVDARGTVDVTQNEGFRTLTMDYGDGDGNYGQLNLNIVGNVSASNSMASEHITAGRTTPVTSYDLFVDENARIEGTLEVTNLEFIGSGTPDTLTSISAPQNVNIYVDDSKTVSNKPNGILRTKEFSIDQKLVLVNNSLDYNDTNVIGTADTDLKKDLARVEAIQTGSNDYGYSGTIPVWAKDSMSYGSYAFTEYSSTYGDSLDADTISAAVSSSSAYFRYNMDRVTLATLGTIKMTYIGRLSSTAVGASDITTYVQTYEFDTPYFKDRDGSSVVNWYPDSSTTIANNFAVKIDANIIDDQNSSGDPYVGTQQGPQIYNVNRPVWIYIPLSSWTAYRIPADGSLSDEYHTIYLAQRWAYKLEDQNNIAFSMLNTHVNSLNNKNWYLAVYPRFKRISRTSVGIEDQYDAEWDLNIIAVTNGDGTSANLIGRMYITRTV